MSAIRRAAPHGRLLRAAPAVAVFLTLVAAGGGVHAGPNRFRNVWNVPFASVSNGPQGAVVVEARPGRTVTAAEAVQRRQAVRDAIAQQHSPRALTQAVEALRYLRTRGVKPRAQLRVPRTIVHTSGGRPVLPDLDRTLQGGGVIGDANNNLTFTFQGFSSADEQTFRAYLNDALPVARAVYGPPAFNLTVKVIQDDTLQAIQGGTYDVTANEIRLPPPPSDGGRNWPEDTFVLMLLVLNAFHDDVALFYDSWEQGMTGAAATAVQVSPGVSPGYDPANPGPFYSGAVYEPMNQPQLGNSTWFPASGFSGMLVWRIAHSRAAWMKCYVEDPQFFLRFNTQYYARLNALSGAQRAALPGDTPGLLQICQAVLPTVEGAPFVSWYRQQYALDTSVTIGSKLYCWNIPLADAVVLIVEHYETQSTGDEIPKGGTAQTVYFNYDFTLTLFAQEGNEIPVPSTGDAAGEGFLLPTFFNVGGPQRITVQIELNGLVGRYPFPYGVRDFEGDGTNVNDIYGAILGPLSGTIQIVGLNGLSGVQVSRGVWSGVINDHTLSPAQLEITFDDGNGNQVTRKVNVAYDSYDVLLAAGNRSALAKNLPYGTNGLYLFSVPLAPVEQDAARALGLPAEELMLARWKPGAPGGGQYEIYPTIDPFAPGRGFWLRILRDVTLAVDGVLPAADDDVRVPLSAGWNMIGCARNREVDLADLLVQRGTESKPFADAVTAGWVQSGLWAYGQQAGYSLVQRLKPFEGYWVRCLLPKGATLIFPPPGSAPTARERGTRAAYSPFGETAWRTRLLLEVGEARGSATLGAAASAGDGPDPRCDLQAPPAFGDQPTLGFVSGDEGAEAGEYASDFRATNARGPWRLRVSRVPPGATARVTWPDLSQVPQDLRPVLIDRARGREVHMRTVTGYAFTGSGAPAELEIELRAVDAGGLAVMGLAGVPTRQGVEITYSLSAEAAVSARILNIAGRPVRDLVQDRLQAAGRSTLRWDLRSAAGLPVPNGAYLVELTARSEDGQLARGLSRVSVHR
ncbi:MAG: hypothetical protein FJX74_11570 [Armatimonadetes bacterium]|nr:hypothetical protein [Armatimonadota bacterium]